jgi:hypothetical protein
MWLHQQPDAPRQSGAATGKYGITANGMQGFGENHVSVSVRPLCMRLGSAKGGSNAFQWRCATLHDISFLST